MKRAAAILAAVGAVVLAAGCGGGSDNSDPAEEQAIRDLVAQVNRATENRDPEAACAVIAPSSLKATFQTRARCIRETGVILKRAGSQPRVEVDSIEISGDRATVSFKGRNGQIEVVREDGDWYIPIASDQGASGEPTGSEEDSQ